MITTTTDPAPISASGSPDEAGRRHEMAPEFNGGLELYRSGNHLTAGVERIEIKSRETFYASRIGPYIKIEGVFTGSLDPAGESIPGLDKAARRPDGRVEYRSNFIIVAPESQSVGNELVVQYTRVGLQLDPIDGQSRHFGHKDAPQRIGHR